MSEKLLNCPFCGKAVIWCDFAGEKVSGECCDNIVCTSCPAEFQFVDTSENGRETLKELQSDNVKVFNTRTLPQEVKDVMTALKAYIDYWDSGLPCVITEEKANLWKAFKSFKEANDAT